jgi:hypothetical protein
MNRMDRMEEVVGRASSRAAVRPNRSLSGPDVGGHQFPEFAQTTRPVTFKMQRFTACQSLARQGSGCWLRLESACVNGAQVYDGEQFMPRRGREKGHET